MKIHHKQCQYCSNRFQTWDENKVFCSQQCEAFDKIKVIPHEENPQVEIVENIASRRSGVRQCRHCGRIDRPLKSHPYHSKQNFYCDGRCAMARVLYNKNKNTTQCLECEIEFSKLDSCKEATQNKKRNEELAKKRIERANKDTTPKKRRGVSLAELNRRAEVRRLEYEWKRLVK
jgi:hypothetical protein